MHINIKHISPELLRGLRARGVPSLAESNHVEVRVLALFVTWSFINDLVGPITYVFGLSPSLLYKVASLAHASWLIGGLFVAALLLALPHAFALLLFPGKLAIRWPRRAATLAAALVTLTWCYLAILALPLDVGPLFWLYMRQAVESVGLAFIYAISLNAQLLRAINRLLQE